jgi:hypothetical protein
VRVCARLYVAARDPQRAAKFLGEAHLAAEATEWAAEAGDLDLLEQGLTALHRPQEKAHEAQVAYAAYQAALSQGHFTEALSALEQAMRSRPDNPAYADLHARLLAQRPQRVVLQGEGILLALAESPAWFGRGEDVQVRLQAPGVSRRHARLVVSQGRATLTGPRGELLWQDEIRRGRRGTATTLALGKLTAHVRAAGMGTVIQTDIPSAAAMVFAQGGSAPLDALDLPTVEVGLRWPKDGFPRLMLHGAAMQIDGELSLAGGRDLAVGSAVEFCGRCFTVVGSL